MTSVTIHLPDDIAARYARDELAHCVLEDFAVQEYAQGRVTLMGIVKLTHRETLRACLKSGLRDNMLAL